MPPYVIMITANEGRRHMQYAESMGVDSYMLKPINNQRLIEEVKKGLGIRSQERWIFIYFFSSIKFRKK